MLRKFCALGGALALVAALSGCSKVSSAEAMQFNDALVEASRRVSLSGLAFSEAAARAVGGGVMEVARADREYENVMEALARARSDMKLVKVPDSPFARKYFEEHQKLLQHQDQVVREDFKAILKVLDDPLITPDVRLRKLRPIADYLKSMDHSQVANLKAAQAAFAREFGFQVRNI